VTLRVLIADDQAVVRSGLKLMLEAEGDLEVVAEAENGRLAVEMALRLRPDVCLLDIRMPVMSGIEATALLAGPAVARPIPVVIITTFDLDELVHGALKAGARGFLLKDAGPALLTASIRAAASGEALISPAITARFLAQFADATAKPAAPREPLTTREEEVLLTVARGLTNHDIATELHISLSTVKSHLASLMTKLGARNRVELALWAYETKRIRR
jgi:DNA-binding NarL/FixJ family response regulator